MARAGELQRVPRVMYYKRYHRDNVHTKWAEWPLERRKHGWQVHCRDMFLEAVRAEATLAERRCMWSAVLERLRSRTAAGYLPVDAFDEADCASMTAGFLATFGDHSSDVEYCLETPWTTLMSEAWPRHARPGQQ